jgi:hypothetical protein
MQITTVNSLSKSLNSEPLLPLLTHPAWKQNSTTKMAEQQSSWESVNVGSLMPLFPGSSVAEATDLALHLLYDLVGLPHLTVNNP